MDQGKGQNQTGQAKRGDHRKIRNPSGSADKAIDNCSHGKILNDFAGLPVKAPPGEAIADR
jgi:hypothetical protein